jgi:hypothetical protein
MHGQHEILKMYLECECNRLTPTNLEPPATKEDSILEFDVLIQVNTLTVKGRSDIGRKSPSS